MGPENDALIPYSRAEDGESKKSPIIFSGNDSSLWTKWTEEIEHKYELWKWEVNDDIIDQEVLDRTRAQEIAEGLYWSKIEKLSSAGRNRWLEPKVVTRNMVKDRENFYYFMYNRTTAQAHRTKSGAWARRTSTRSGRS